MDAVSSADVQVVLEWVDHFYATSWSHLLVCLGVMGAIVGVLVPVLIQHYQNRTIRLEREEIRAAIVGQVTEAVRDLMSKEIVSLEERIATETKLLADKLARDRAELEEKSRKMEGGLQKRIATTTGALFGVQANMMVSQHGYALAVKSIIFAFEEMMVGDEHVNMRRLFDVLTQRCLPKMTKEDCGEIDEGERGFGRVMERIKKWDLNRDFQDAIRDAKRAFEQAKVRDSVEGE